MNPASHTLGNTSSEPGEPQAKPDSAEFVPLVPLQAPQKLALIGVTADHSIGSVVIQLVRVGLAADLPSEGHTFYRIPPSSVEFLCEKLSDALAELEQQSVETESGLDEGASPRSREGRPGKSKTQSAD